MTSKLNFSVIACESFSRTQTSCLFFISGTVSNYCDTDMALVKN